MQVQLIVTDKRHEGQTIPVDVPTFKIGQAEGCHLRSNSSRISPYHCAIYTHGSTVTIQDLGGENGTYINGERILARKVLKDGDELVVGRHSFIVSIKTGIEKPKTGSNDVFELAPASAVQSMPEQSGLHTGDSYGAAVQESEVLFDIRYRGQNVSVTKSRLFEMALKGMVSPDDVIIVAGTKIFADSIHGIVFGKKASAAPLPNNVEVPATASATFAVQKPADAGSAPFDITSEPRVQTALAPSDLREKPFAEMRKTLEGSWEQASTLANKSLNNRVIKVFAGVFTAVCLLVLLGFWLMSGKNPYGTVYVAGTVMLDGVPVERVIITLYPRDERGATAGGTTNGKGRFTLTTGAARPGSGAKPGEYDVTFAKTRTIPQKYGNPVTSGLEPIRVTSEGRNRYVFELTSESEVLQAPDTSQSSGGTEDVP